MKRLDVNQGCSDSSGRSIRIRLFSALFLLLFVTAVPSQWNTWFDGLPWTTGPETVLMMVVVPVVLLLGWKFLLLKGTGIALAMLFILKLVLVGGAPADGWQIRVFPTQIDYEKGAWIETYTTIWRKDVSGLLVRPWSNKVDFPLEWAIQKLTSQRIWANKFDAVTAPDDFDDVRPVLEISGSVRFTEPARLAIVVDGVAEGSVEITNTSGRKVSVNLVTRDRQTDLFGGEVTTGDWNIAGALTYAGDDWSLEPVLINREGKIDSPFKRHVLFQSPAKDLPSPEFVSLFSRLSEGYSALLIVFFSFWLAWLCWTLIEKGVLVWSVVLFGGITALLLPLTEALLDALSIGTGANLAGAPVGLALLVSGSSLLAVMTIWSYPRQALEDNMAQVVILVFGPAMFLFYVLRWWSGLDHVAVLSSGDDWTHYQLLAFRIAAWGDVLSGGGESMFYYQPFYRYVAAFFHWLFGKSFVPQQLFDVWCVLGSAAIVAGLVRRFNVSVPNALLASILYLVPVLMSPVRHHIGRGLAENTSMIFLMLAAWFLIQNRYQSWSRIVFAGVFGVLGYWTRQDHLLITGALVFLLIEPVTGRVPTGWRIFKAHILSNWKYLVCYGLIIGSGVLLLLLRNWILSGTFWLNPADHPNYVFVRRFDEAGLPIPIQWQPIYFFQKIQLILTMKPVGQLPSPFSVVLIIGTLFGLMALIWRPKFLQAIPIAFGLTFIAAFIPYYFVDNWGYPPRYSIHVLPIATISFIIVWDRWTKSLKRRNKWFFGK